jgi:hypothetical protein
MMTLSIFAGLAFGGWVFALVVPLFAPAGYEDETGFHYGSPKAEVKQEWVGAAPEALGQPA